MNNEHEIYHLICSDISFAVMTEIWQPISRRILVDARSVWGYVNENVHYPLDRWRGDTAIGCGLGRMWP